MTAASLWFSLDVLTWVLLGAAPVLLLGAALHRFLRDVAQDAARYRQQRAARHRVEDVRMDPFVQALLDDHMRLNRQRNLTLAFLEHLTEAAALALPADPALDTLPQRALRQQVQASNVWCDSLRERDIAPSARGVA